VSGGGPAPVATVIVPTHDHPGTLDLAVASVQAQTVDALDIVIIGDGVGDETRDVVAPLTTDRRVRFLDTPKSASRAEPVRHAVLTEARSPIVTYLGDDDLMLADHVACSVAYLETADFVHPLPLCVEAAGGLQLIGATDLTDPACVAWHLHPERNTVALTGVAHRLDAYRRLPHGWREAPADRWSDHYMWEQWFTTPGMRLSSGDRLTVLKFAESARAGMDPAERRRELTAWLRRAAEPGFAAWVELEVGRASYRHAILRQLELAVMTDQWAEERTFREAHAHRLEAVLTDQWAEERKVREAHAHRLEELLAAQQTSIQELTARVEAATDAARAAQRWASAAVDAASRADDEVHAMRTTRTWRLHDRVTGSEPFTWLARHLPLSTGSPGDDA